MLLVSLGLDGLTGVVQEWILKQTKSGSHYDLMFAMNLWAVVFLPFCALSWFDRCPWQF